VNRRAAIGAVVTLSVIAFVIRVAILFLKKEARPPPSSVVDRSHSSPVVALPQTREEASARLRVLASEARAAKETEAATAAYDAERALAKDDCAGAKAALELAGERIAKDSATRGAHESAARSVEGYCANR
jgi:hypothetical protein